MVKVIKNEDPPILELEIGDELKEEDYDIIRPALEEKIDKHGEVNCLVRIEGVPRFYNWRFSGRFATCIGELYRYEQDRHCRG